MQIDLPNSTVNSVKTFLETNRPEIDIVDFIDQSVQRALFFGTVNEIHKRNADVDPEMLDSIINEAITST